MPSSPFADSFHGAIIAAAPSRAMGAEGFLSHLRTQDEVDALCEKYGVPKEFTARPAGDLCANSTPPPGAICVYARALEAGMSFPLHGFFLEALAHFGIAPAQLTPNGWRFMAGFVALCRSSGVPPSLAVFLRFFSLYVIDGKRKKGWYFFKSRSRRESSGLRFTGMPSGASTPIRGWKRHFFFLSSPEPWRCAVEWGEPSERSFIRPVLTVEEMMSAVNLLSAHGGIGNAVDLRNLLPATCPPRRYRLRYSNLAVSAAMVTTASPPPWQASPSARKRTWEEANALEEVVPLSVRLPPPRHFPSGHDGHTTEWDAARELLQGAFAPPLLHEFAVEQRSDEAAIRQAANYVIDELEEKLMSREREAAALRAQLDEAKNERAAAGAELEETKAELIGARAEAVKTKAVLAEAKQAAELVRAEVVKTMAELAAAERSAEAEFVRAKTELAAAGAELEGTKAELAAARAEAVKTKAELIGARAEVVKTKAVLAEAKQAAELVSAEVVKTMAELAVAERSAEAEFVRAKTELTAAKRAAEVELVRAKAKVAAAETELESANAAPVQQILASDEHVRQGAEQGLEGYEQWRGHQAPAGRAA